MEQQQNEYYTPELSEMYIGYEYERAEVHGFGQFEVDGMLPIRSWYKEIVGIEEQDERDIVTIPINTFTKYYRTKYLDREDIESEGWVYDNNCSAGDEYVYKHYTLTDVDDSHNIYIHDRECIVYYGSCLSINELRVIQRLIGIK